MMNYLWAIFVITALDGGENQHTHIKTYESRLACEISAAVFTVHYEPFEDNETVECLKVDQ